MIAALAEDSAAALGGVARVGDVLRDVDTQLTALVDVAARLEDEYAKGALRLSLERRIDLTTHTNATVRLNAHLAAARALDAETPRVRELAATTKFASGVNALGEMLNVSERPAEYVHLWSGMLDVETKRTMGMAPTWDARFFVLLAPVGKQRGAQLKYYPFPLLPGNERFARAVGAISITSGTRVQSRAPTEAERAMGKMGLGARSFDVHGDGVPVTLRAATETDAVRWCVAIVAAMSTHVLKVSGGDDLGRGGGEHVTYSSANRQVDHIAGARALGRPSSFRTASAKDIILGRRKGGKRVASSRAKSMRVASAKGGGGAGKRGASSRAKSVRVASAKGGGAPQAPVPPPPPALAAKPPPPTTAKPTKPPPPTHGPMAKPGMSLPAARGRPASIRTTSPRSPRPKGTRMESPVAVRSGRAPPTAKPKSPLQLEVKAAAAEDSDEFQC